MIVGGIAGGFFGIFVVSQIWNRLVFVHPGTYGGDIVYIFLGLFRHGFNSGRKHGVRNGTWASRRIPPTFFKERIEWSDLHFPSLLQYTS